MGRGRRRRHARVPSGTGLRAAGAWLPPRWPAGRRCAPPLVAAGPPSPRPLCNDGGCHGGAAGAAARGGDGGPQRRRRRHRRAAAPIGRDRRRSAAQLRPAARPARPRRAVRSWCLAAGQRGRGSHLGAGACADGTGLRAVGRAVGTHPGSAQGQHLARRSLALHPPGLLALAAARRPRAALRPGADASPGRGAAGVRHGIRVTTASPATARLWAAALAFPITQTTAEHILQRLDNPTAQELQP